MKLLKGDAMTDRDFVRAHLFPLDRETQEQTFNDLPSAVRNIDPLTQAIEESSSEAVALFMMELQRRERFPDVL